MRGCRVGGGLGEGGRMVGGLEGWMVYEVGVIGMDGLDGVNVGGWMKGGTERVDACAAEDGGWRVMGCRWWRGVQDWMCG